MAERKRLVRRRHFTICLHELPPSWFRYSFEFDCVTFSLIGLIVIVIMNLIIILFIILLSTLFLFLLFGVNGNTGALFCSLLKPFLSGIINNSYIH